LYFCVSTAKGVRRVTRVTSSLYIASKCVNVRIYAEQQFTTDVCEFLGSELCKT